MEKSKECSYPTISVSNCYITADALRSMFALLGHITDMENKSILKDHNQQTLCPLDVPLCNDGPKHTAKQFQVVGSLIR